jgi:hypothetical protein
MTAGGPSLYDVLDGWDLLDEKAELGKLSLKDWRKVADALELAARSASPEPSLGSVHLGLFDGHRAADGVADVRQLAPYVLLFDRLWLPDPMFSALTHSAADTWSFLPDSGGTYFSDRPGVHEPDAPNVWKHRSPDERRNFIMRRLPAVLRRLAELRPLVEAGAIGFVPWETALLDASFREKLLEFVRSHREHALVTEVTQRHLQENYNLGPRVGAIGMQLGKGEPVRVDGPQEGDPLWFKEKSPFLVLGALNASFSHQVAASMAPSLPGDRDVYDYVVSNGVVAPAPQPLAEAISLPRFSAAAWADVAAIRRDADSLALFRGVLKEAAGAEESVALPYLREKLTAAADTIKKDNSLWTAVKGSLAEASVGAVLVGGLAAIAAESVPAAGLAALIGALPGLGHQALAGKRRAAVKRAEVILRVVDRM